MSLETVKADLNIIFGAIKDAESSLTDGFQTTDLITLVPVATQIPTVIKSWKEAKTEIGQIDATQIADLQAFIGTNLELKNSKTKEEIMSAINFVFAGYTLIESFKKAA